MLTHCIYASRAAHAMSDDVLLEILRRSRTNNAAASVTGMLLHVDDSFFQVLEGEPHAVEAAMVRIKGDVRHAAITRIIDEPIAKRAFPGWSMGFSTLDRQQLQDVAGLNDFFDTGRSLLDLDEGRAKRLLRAFAQGRWRASPTFTNNARAA
jgi:hypothetical protein